MHVGTKIFQLVVDLMTAQSAYQTCMDNCAVESLEDEANTWTMPLTVAKVKQVGEMMRKVLTDYGHSSAEDMKLLTEVVETKLMPPVPWEVKSYS